jgi:hypothetical protein
MKPEAFTLKNPKVLRALITHCYIGEAHDKQYCKGNPPTKKQYQGLWDTGASASMISARVVKELGLKPIRQIETRHAQGSTMSNLYYINMMLPNGIEIANIAASEGILFDFDVLIGMDVIGLGDFALTHKNGQTVFSFQIPSTHEYDFVKQIQNGVGVKKGKKK